MKKGIFILLALLWCCVSAKMKAQQPGDAPFRAYLYNGDYKVFMRINLYEQDITIPGQELFGQMAGYLSKVGTSYCWLVAAAEVDGRKARMLISNDYGSEDLEAELTQDDDSTFTLRRLSGATLKVPDNGKCMKLPHNIKFKKKGKEYFFTCRCGCLHCRCGQPRQSLAFGRY